MMFLRMNKHAFKRYPKVKVAIDVAAVSMPTCSVLTQLKRRRFNGVYLRKSMLLRFQLCSAQDPVSNKLDVCKPPATSMLMSCHHVAFGYFDACHACCLAVASLRTPGPA